MFIYETTFEHEKLGLSITRDLIVNEEFAPGTVQVGDKVIAVNGGGIEKGTSLVAVVKLIASLPRPIKITFARNAAGSSVDDAIVINEGDDKQDSRPDDDVVDLTQPSPGSNKPSQSPMTSSSASRLASQPSQRSAESQMSAGGHSPDLLASQPS